MLYMETRELVVVTLTVGKFLLSRGGGTGFADSVTAGPIFSVWCLKNEQMRSQRSSVHG